MVWFELVIAGLLEVTWSVGLKHTHGFTRPIPSLLVGLAIIGSMLMLGRATRMLPIGTAYAVWVGIGVIGAALGGFLLFGEAMPPRRAFFLALLVVAIVGLKLTAGPSAPDAPGTAADDAPITPPAAAPTAEAEAAARSASAPAPPAACSDRA